MCPVCLDVQRGGKDVDQLNEPAVLEMRGGPSDSACRRWVQTTLCCVGPMTRVVNESAKGGTMIPSGTSWADERK